MLRHPDPDQPAIIKTDHRPLIYFMNSPLVQGIYSRWSSELHALNVRLEYIGGERNPVADGLSRVVFPQEDCQVDEILASMGDLSMSESGTTQWICKDGKGGYEQLLAARRVSPKCSDTPVIPKNTIPRKPVALRITSLDANSTTLKLDTGTNIDTGFAYSLQSMDNNLSILAPSDRYSEDPFFHDIFNLLACAEMPPQLDRLGQRALQLKTSQYRLAEPLHIGGKFMGDLLFVGRGGNKAKRCVPMKEVASTIWTAHDGEGHWKLANNMKKLAQFYWPNMASDVKRYITGCLACARNGPAQRSQTHSPIIINQPSLLIGMDFVGHLDSAKLTLKEAISLMWPTLSEMDIKDFAFPADFDTKFQVRIFTHLLVIVDYFTSFAHTFPVLGATASETIRCLTWLFDHEGAPVAIYSDIGTHFTGNETQNFLRKRGTLFLLHHPKLRGLLE